VKNDLVVHPLAAKFPMLDSDELNALADDIVTNGQQEPCLLDKDGRLIDGRNRLAACEIADVEPRFETFDGDEDAIIALIISRNVRRRHLSKGQQAMAVAFAYPEGEQGKRTSLFNKEVEGVNSGYLSKARTVFRLDPPLADSVFEGAVALNDAYDKVRGRETEVDKERGRFERLRAARPDLAEKVTNGELSLEDAERQAKADADARRSQRVAATQNLVASVRTADRPLGHVDYMIADFDPELAKSLGEKITADRLRAAAAFYEALAARWGDISA
jgi:hypothetical protein